MYIIILIIFVLVFLYINKIFKETFTDVNNLNKKKNIKWKFKQNNIISFPRSGQHLIERTLKNYHNFKNMPYSYCEYYNCCNEIPCLYNLFYQKNHDFHQTLSINPQWKYIYLYRENKIENIEAYFRYYYLPKLRDKRMKMNIDYENEETYNKLLSFCKTKMSYYNNLKNKYVSTQYENVLPIEYNNLVLKPQMYIEKILNFFNFNTNSIEIIDFIENHNEKIEKRNSLNKEIYERLKKDLKL